MPSKDEETLASTEHSVADTDSWEASGFREEDAQESKDRQAKR